MPEEKVVETEPKIIEPKKPEVKDDLVQRVSQVKTEAPKEEEFDYKKIDEIQDPKAKELFWTYYKEAQRSFTKKFQSLATKKENLEHQPVWTKEKVKDLLKDQSFLSAARDIIPQDESSMLTEPEKASIKAAKDRADFAVSQASEAKRLREDEVLNNKYANYNAQGVDVITADLISGKLKATREDLHKVLDYDDAIKRAYSLGKEDKKVDTKEKIDSTSVDGVTTNISEAPLKRIKGESDRVYFQRLGEHNLAKFKK